MEEKKIVQLNIEKSTLQFFIQSVRGLISVNQEYTNTLITLADTNKAFIDFNVETESFNENAQTIIGTFSQIINILLQNQEQNNIKEAAQSVIKAAQTCALEFKEFGNKISTVKEDSVNLQRCFDAIVVSNESVKKNIQSLLDILHQFEESIPVASDLQS